MRKTILFTILTILPSSFYAQRHDFTIIFGYAGGNESPNDDSFGINIMTFEDGSAKFVDNQVMYQ